MVLSYQIVNYWAEPAATPRNPDLAMAVRREVYKEDEIKNREGDEIKTPREVAQELRGHRT